MNKRDEFDLAILNAYWMYRDDLITEEVFLTAVNRLKGLNNEERRIGEEQKPIIISKEILKKSRKGSKSKMTNAILGKNNRTKFTPEVVKFLKENLELKSAELAEAINKKFKIGTTANGINNYKFLHGLGKKNKKKDKIVSLKIKPMHGPYKTKKCEDCKETTWEGWYNGKQLCNACIKKRKKGKTNFEPLYEKEIDTQLKEIGSEDDFENDLDIGEE
jgi:hypothetical protein